MSNLIIENIINNNNKNLKFDFSKSITENIGNQVNHNYDDQLPIEINAKHEAWEHINEAGIEKIKKIYHFKNVKHMMYFINEYMTKIKSINKKPDMIVKDSFIIMSLYTENIMEVTNIDLDLAKYLDDVNEDIVYIQGL